jgi:hypothetical protein
MTTPNGYAVSPFLCSCKPSETSVNQQNEWASKNGWKHLGLWENLFIPSCPCWESVANAFWQPMLDLLREDMREFKVKTGYGILWQEEIES